MKITLDLKGTSASAITTTLEERRKELRNELEGIEFIVGRRKGRGRGRDEKDLPDLGIPTHFQRVKHFVSHPWKKKGNKNLRKGRRRKRSGGQIIKLSMVSVYKLILTKIDHRQCQDRLATNEE